MLHIARPYDELHRSDLTLYLRDQRPSDHRTDAILLADVGLCRRIACPLSEASHAIEGRRGYSFTVELDQQEGRLNGLSTWASQRYAHMNHICASLQLAKLGSAGNESACAKARGVNICWIVWYAFGGNKQLK